MFFFIADISGYTQFMLKNQKDFAHGKLVIMELMQALIEAVKMPMEISKLEGDAVLLFLRKGELKDNPLQLTEKLLTFFTRFSDKLRQLQESTTCTCGGCLNIGQLNLKMVGHFGKATLDKIGQFVELSGVDVIIPHRLLKNTIEGHRYLLVTEQAFEHLLFPQDGHIARHEETYPDLGKVPTYVYFPPGYEPKGRTYNTPWHHFLSHMMLFFGTLTLRFQKPATFRNLPKR